MNGMRIFKLLAIVGMISGVLGSVDSAEAFGLRHRCCVPVCRPMPCPVIVAAPVRVVAVPVVMPMQVVHPAPVPAVGMTPGMTPGMMPVSSGPRVVTKTYKITKIRYKVPKKQPAPVVVCPPVCAPVVCPPIICCPVPVVCPPVCIPARCCPLRRCL